LDELLLLNANNKGVFSVDDYLPGKNKLAGVSLKNGLFQFNVLSPKNGAEVVKLCNDGRMYLNIRIR
jgi:hypothetical protein